jgi:hypothetical protein
MLAIPSYGLKAASMSRLSDPTKPVATVLFACTLATFVGPMGWSFLYSVVVPFLLTTPQLAKFEVSVKRVFAGFAVLCGGVMFSVILLQLLDVEGEGRRALSTAFFTSLGFVASLCVFVLCVGGWKVRVVSPFYGKGGGGPFQTFPRYSHPKLINCRTTPILLAAPSCCNSSTKALKRLHGRAPYLESW